MLFVARKGRWLGILILPTHSYTIIWKRKEKNAVFRNGMWISERDEGEG